LQVPDYHHPEAHSKGLAPARNLGGVEDFVNELRSMQVTPHVAQNTSVRRSRIDGRTTFTFAAAAYHLVRLPKLLAETG
jgi:hypothetical protein